MQAMCDRDIEGAALKSDWEVPYCILDVSEE